MIAEYRCFPLTYIFQSGARSTRIWFYQYVQALLFLPKNFPNQISIEVTTDREYEYTFANIAKTIEAFTEALKLSRFAIYIFDYGAPTGLRLVQYSTFCCSNSRAYIIDLPLPDQMRSPLLLLRTATHMKKGSENFGTAFAGTGRTRLQHIAIRFDG